VLNTSEGCGVLSRAEFSRKDRIGLIPRHLLITTTLARKKSVTSMAVHSYMANKRKMDSWRAVLAVFLMEERSNPRSFWRPYIRSLPRTLHHLPMFWGNQTRSWLQGSPFLKSVDENRKEIRKEWEHILHAVPALREEYNFEEYFCGGGAEKALVPLADLLNHRKHGSFTVSWGFNQKLDGFELKAFRDIGVGDALTDSYGESKSAEQFVRMYGFTPSAEEDEEEVDQEDQEQQQQQQNKEDNRKTKRMPVLLTRNVNVSHLFVLDATRRLYREEIENCDVFSISRRGDQKSPELCDQDDISAYVKESVKGDEQQQQQHRHTTTTLEETSKIYDAGKGTSSFRIRGKIRPKDRAPTYLEDARFLSYLRGVAQAYVDGFDKSVRDDTFKNEKSLQRHEAYALQAADFMLKHPHRAAKNGLNASLDAEYLAVRVFVEALDNVLESQGTTLSEDRGLLELSSKQSIEETMSAERRELGIDAAERDRWLVWTQGHDKKMTSSTISFNEQLALRHRIGEKRLLWMYRDLALEELNLMERMSRVISRRVNESTATSTLMMPDRPRFLCESFRALGREVWARWQKGSFWYKGYVTAVNFLHNDAGVTFNIRFDDGDMEDGILSSNVRWGSDPLELSRLGDLDGRVLFTDRNDVMKAIGMNNDDGDNVNEKKGDGES